MKQWKKSSRWRAAVRREHNNIRNSWRLTCVWAGTNPFRPIPAKFRLFWMITRALVVDQFVAQKPFQSNMGAKTIRFVK